MKEIVRKLIHLIFGLAIAGMVMVLDKPTATAILAGGLFIGIVLVDLLLRGYKIPVFSSLVDYGDRCDPLPGKGAFFFAVSALVCLILFPVPIVVPALVTIAVLDSVTTLVGITYGKRRIYNGKSWEGTTAGILVTILVLLPFLTVPGALVIAVIAGLIELFSPIDDNLVVPVSVCIILFLFPVLI
jgi:dolichol kinase